MPLLKDRVSNLEYTIEKLQEELRKIRELQQKEEEYMPTKKESTTQSRRRAAI